MTPPPTRRRRSRPLDFNGFHRDMEAIVRQLRAVARRYPRELDELSRRAYGPGARRSPRRR